jgi:hypothetical protein
MQSPAPNADKPAGNKQKTMSKKERRELQDAQRAEKAQLKDKREKTGSGSKNPKPPGAGGDGPTTRVPAQMRQDDPRVFIFFQLV